MVQLFSNSALLQLKWPNTLHANASLLAFERECTIRYCLFKLAMGVKVLGSTDPLNDHPKLRLLIHLLGYVRVNFVNGFSEVWKIVDLKSNHGDLGLIIIF